LDAGLREISSPVVRHYQVGTIERKIPVNHLDDAGMLQLETSANLTREPSGTFRIPESLQNARATPVGVILVVGEKEITLAALSANTLVRPDPVSEDRLLLARILLLRCARNLAVADGPIATCLVQAA
jgi:hypothetical protein